MRALVTGATGFVGSHLARALCEAGHEVAVMRREGSATRLLDGLAVEHRIADLRDAAAVRAAARGRDTVFHVAGSYSLWEARYGELYEVNVLGTRHVVDACLAEGARLIKTGSVVGYAGTPEPIACDESGNGDVRRWRSFHVVSMALAEREVLQGCARGLWAVQLHPSLIFGEGDVNHHASWVLIDAEARRHPWASRLVPGGGLNAVAVEDVVRAHLLAAERGRRGESYLIGGENLTRAELTALAEEVIHGAARLRMPLPAAPLRLLGLVGEAVGRLRGDDARNRIAMTDIAAQLTPLYWWVRCDKAERDLGYRPGPVRPAIERAWRWLRAEREARRAAREEPGTREQLHLG